MKNTVKNVGLVCALLLAAAGCSKKDDAAKTDTKAADKKNDKDPLVKLEGFVEKLCACKDAACADAVEKEMADWGAKQKDEKKPTDAEMKKAMDLMKKMTACQEKLGGGGLDDADQFIFKSSKDDLQEAKDMLAKGEDPSLSCVAATSYGDKLRDKKVPEVEAHLKDLDKTCGYDIPLALAEKEVVKAEEGRKKDPKGVVSDCFNATYETNMELLKKTAAADEKVKALEGRFAAACPK